MLELKGEVYLLSREGMTSVWAYNIIAGLRGYFRACGVQMRANYPDLVCAL